MCDINKCKKGVVNYYRWLSTFAFPMGRQKLESRTSAETGNDSPYLEHITHQIKNHLKLEIMLEIFKLQELV